MTFVVKGEELRMNLRFQACITERMIMPLTSLGRRENLVTKEESSREKLEDEVVNLEVSQRGF